MQPVTILPMADTSPALVVSIRYQDEKYLLHISFRECETPGELRVTPERPGDADVLADARKFAEEFSAFLQFRGVFPHKPSKETIGHVIFSEMRSRYPALFNPEQRCRVCSYLLAPITDRVRFQHCYFCREPK